MGSRLKVWTAVVAFVVAVLGLYPAADAVGLDLPRFAWKGELVRVAEQGKDTRRRLLKYDLKETQLQKYTNRREAEKYRQAGQQEPDWLINEMVTLEEKERDLQRELRALDRD